MADDYDGAWKEALETYFEDFMTFFLPVAHAEIDWVRGYTFLDQELSQIVQDAELGKRRVDKLVQVWRRDGVAVWVLVHIEIQSQHDAEFAERMYVYHYRIYDRYRRPVCSVAILGDEAPRWRPARFGYELWECEIAFRFPVVKLVDYNEKWAELEASANPFATVVMAHLKTQATAHDDRARQAWKLALMRRLYRLGYRRNDVIRLYRFIDWLMQLPKSLDQELWQTIKQEEGEQTMPYISYAERVGMEEGLEKGLQQGLRQGLLPGIELALKLKFGQAGVALMPEIRQIEDVALLQAVQNNLEFAATVEAVRSVYRGVAA